MMKAAVAIMVEAVCSGRVGVAGGGTGGGLSLMTETRSERKGYKSPEIFKLSLKRGSLILCVSSPPEDRRIRRAPSDSESERPLRIRSDDRLH